MRLVIPRFSLLFRIPSSFLYVKSWPQTPLSLTVEAMQCAALQALTRNGEQGQEHGCYPGCVCCGIAHPSMSNQSERSFSPNPAVRLPPAAAGTLASPSADVMSSTCFR